eukprot:TRINITY_DN6754_c0_g1_i1.p1 TRINITY_DN6754_c0_g1~~TRINITY_DN6754_c0_g1_i1.p1  ORF type:complete len:101 (+),score=14.16 TRINITY_DN6754_c0_g1_i1:80-382(+)
MCIRDRLRAPDWSDSCKSDDMLGDLAKKWAADENSIDEETRQEWTSRGNKVPGIRFYATTGAPTGHEGFAFWEVSPKSVGQVEVVDIDASGKRVRRKYQS